MVKRSIGVEIERALSKLLTDRDREITKLAIVKIINTYVHIKTLLVLVMRRPFAKYLIVAGISFLTLFGIYLYR